MVSPAQLWGRLIRTRATPEAISRGSAVGIFFGFTPLFGLKTLMSMGIARLCGGSAFAAAVAVTLHDVLLPLMPAILLSEYRLGLWMLGRDAPPPVNMEDLWRAFHWTTFLQDAGLPLLLGSLPVGLATAVPAYLIMRFFVTRHRRGDPPGDSNSGRPGP
jgi:uncharacterized protein (DUF2062 family)